MLQKLLLVMTAMLSALFGLDAAVSASHAPAEVAVAFEAESSATSPLGDSNLLLAAAADAADGASDSQNVALSGAVLAADGSDSTTMTMISLAILFAGLAVFTIANVRRRHAVVAAG